MSRFSFSAAVLPPDHTEDQKTYAERKLTPGETDYELGCFHIGAQDRKTGRELLEQALALDPKLAAAHEGIGFLSFAAGNDKEATAQWQQALALDPSLYRSLFAVTMSGTPLDRQTPDALRETETRVRHITELAPNYAPAYVELALIAWRLNHIQEAYTDAQKAETLEPWRAGYHLLTAHILLAGHQPAVAATYSRYVATHWLGPDHNEAVDVWTAVPQDKRGEGTALTLDVPAGTEVARGTLTALTCNETPQGHTTTATLIPDGAPGAKPLTLTSDGGRLMIGFSDTLWWGEDHFPAVITSRTILRLSPTSRVHANCLKWMCGTTCRQPEFPRQRSLQRRQQPRIPRALEARCEDTYAALL